MLYCFTDLQRVRLASFTLPSPQDHGNELESGIDDLEKGVRH